MCRWAAWSGAPVFLETIVTRPAHSLIAQSRAATECKAGTNGDGFGIAWYGEPDAPGLFRDVRPAWSDPNIEHLCRMIRSRMFLAHVRAATGTATSVENCHPFTHGRWSFMHNGQVGGMDAFRKNVDMAIPEAIYHARRGTTDSEALFLIACGSGLDADPVGAVARATRYLENLSREAGTPPHMRLTACWSDGARLFAARHASDVHAPSLYFRQCDDGYLVVSEPLDDLADGWLPVAPGQCLIVENGQHRFVPFLCPATKKGRANAA